MKFERNYFVHYYDVDLKKRLSITALLRYFEDIAVLQSEERKIGLEYYKKNNVSWVLHKWNIQFHKYPEFKDTIKVITVPRAFVRFYAYRTYEVRSIADEMLASAVSLWFFVDTVSKRPIKITDDMLQGYNVEPVDHKIFDIKDCSQIQHVDYEKSFNVRLGDIDSNNHVNNVKYIEWAMEAIPAELFECYRLSEMKVVYKKETNFGSRITSAVEINNQIDKMTCIHRISDEENENCLLETVWIPEKTDL